MKPSILVVEDDVALCELLTWNLGAEGYDVRSTGDGEEALLMVREQAPDAIILDWMIEQVPGIEVCRQLRKDKETAKVPILMLTARGEEEDRIRGLKTGADDYVTKPFSPKELVARVRAVLRRRAPHLAGEAVEVGDLALNPATHRVLAAGQPIELGPTEFRLLFFFMTHSERVYSRAQLLDEVWGDHVFIEERTVDVHIRRLRAALESSGHHERIETVRGTGYRFRGA